MANREYRDRLFKFVFGNPENKAWTLSLYNAVNGTAYTDAGDIMLYGSDCLVLFYKSFNTVIELVDAVLTGILDRHAVYVTHNKTHGEVFLYAYPDIPYRVKGNIGYSETAGS